MFSENLSAFFNDFGVTATYNGTTAVMGIFDSEDFEVGFGDVGHQSAAPSFLFASALLPALAIGDTLAIGLFSYAVVVIEPDGTGLTRLKLELLGLLPVGNSPVSLLGFFF